MLRAPDPTGPGVTSGRGVALRPWLLAGQTGSCCSSQPSPAPLSWTRIQSPSCTPGKTGHTWPEGGGVCPGRQRRRDRLSLPGEGCKEPGNPAGRGPRRGSGGEGSALGSLTPRPLRAPAVIIRALHVCQVSQALSPAALGASFVQTADSVSHDFPLPGRKAGTNCWCGCGGAVV